MKTLLLFRTLTLCALFVATLSVSAAEKPVNSSVLGKVALHGYDPVAYFTDGKPVEGSKQFSYSWQDANFRFATQEHLDLFKSNPEKYAPQFGGYCAYAVSQGHTADIDPDAWKIVNEKLYLNYNKKVQEMWEKDQAKLISVAEKNWPKLIAPK